jgi:hypothetical protein
MNRSRVLSIVGALCLLLPVLSWALWIYVFSSHPTLTPQAKTDLFLGYFPAFLRNIRGISTGTLILAIASGVLSLMAIKDSRRWLRVLSIGIIILGSLVSLLQLFSMM